MKKPTTEELLQAAQARTYGLSASTRVDNSRGGSFATRSATDPLLYGSVVHSETLPTIRITPAMSERIANYANTNHLNMSETVRTLLTAGLDALEAS